MSFTIADGAETTPPDEAAVQQSVDAGREALDQGYISRVHPWYDSASDGVRRIRLEKPRQSSSWFNWLWLPTFLKVLAWGALLAVLVGLAWLFVWAFLRRDRGVAAASDIDVLGDRGSDIDRVEALPFRINRQTADLLAEARRSYEAGDYSEAVIYLFSHELVELDRHQWIHLARGKTNRQCVREVVSRPLALLVSETMVAFEDVFFGGQSLSRARFEACWFRLDEFHRLVQEARP